MTYYIEDEDSREELGTYKSDPETNRRIREYFTEQSGVNLSVLEKTVGIVFRRFPKLGRGERISGIEIKRRLSEIREAGYPIEKYSHLNSKESWMYLQDLKQKIGGEAMRYCPELLRDIRRRNSEQVRIEKGFR